jgi:ATP-dependent Zn protease
VNQNRATSHLVFCPSGNETAARGMETSMNKWIELLVSWLPFLLLIAVWLLLSRRMGMQARGKSGTTMIELYEQQVEESRRMNANLERIAAALEKRP